MPCRETFDANFSVGEIALLGNPLSNGAVEFAVDWSYSLWMSPNEINEQDAPVGPRLDEPERRSSVKGFLGVSMARNLELLDWGWPATESRHGGGDSDALV